MLKPFCYSLHLLFTPPQTCQGLIIVYSASHIKHSPLASLYRHLRIIVQTWKRFLCRLFSLTTILEVRYSLFWHILEIANQFFALVCTCIWQPTENLLLLAFNKSRRIFCCDRKVSRSARENGTPEVKALRKLWIICTFPKINTTGVTDAKNGIKFTVLRMHFKSEIFTVAPGVLTQSSVLTYRLHNKKAFFLVWNHKYPAAVTQMYRKRILSFLIRVDQTFFYFYFFDPCARGYLLWLKAAVIQGRDYPWFCGKTRTWWVEQSIHRIVTVKNVLHWAYCCVKSRRFFQIDCDLFLQQKVVIFRFAAYCSIGNSWVFIEINS